MPLITIGGVTFTPTDYNVSIMDIDQDSTRTADGTMQRNRIAIKRKIELIYKDLSNADMASLLNALSALFFSVTYTDPQDNSTRTGMFYAGDRNVKGLDYIDNNIRWVEVTFSLVEQ